MKRQRQLPFSRNVFPQQNVIITKMRFCRDGIAGYILLLFTKLYTPKHREGVLSIKNEVVVPILQY